MMSNNYSNEKKGRIQIFAKIMDGKSMAFEVQKSDSIQNIKEKIKEKTGLSVDEEILVYDGAILEDGKSVEDYQIEDEDIILVVARLRGGIQIFAKTMDGKTVTIEVQKSESIQNIKEKIKEKTGLSVDEQRLVYDGAILENSRSVKDYQIEDKAVINLFVRLRGEIQIFARTMDGKIMAFEVQKSDCIQYIKEKIKEKTELSVAEQKLEYQGAILEDSRSVEDYQIGDKAVINVRLRLMSITIQSEEGALFKLNINETDTITEIKRQLKQTDSIFETRDFVLYHQGRSLNELKTFKYYKIDQSSTKIILDLKYGFPPCPVCKLMHGDPVYG